MRGRTYPIRSQLLALGGQWNRRNGWIIEAKKAHELETVLSGPPPAKEVASSGNEVPVIGRARYQSKVYYVLWAGLTEAGNEAMRLVTPDGQRELWVRAAECEWIKQYRRRGPQGEADHEGSFPTLEGIHRFLAAKRQARAARQVDRECEG